jgi:hypothetical protein
VGPGRQSVDQSRGAGSEICDPSGLDLAAELGLAAEERRDLELSGTVVSDHTQAFVRDPLERCHQHRRTPRELAQLQGFSRHVARVA